MEPKKTLGEAISGEMYETTSQAYNRGKSAKMSVLALWIIVSIITGIFLGLRIGVTAPRTNTEAQLKQDNQKCYSRISEAEGKYKILLNTLASGTLALTKSK